MRLVIADTSPINYLVLIGHIELLHVLFGRIILPATVSAELGHPRAPTAIRDWIASPPDWVDIWEAAASRQSDPSMAGLDAGEQDAIALALELHADLVLMDDEEGAAVARFNLSHGVARPLTSENRGH